MPNTSITDEAEAVSESDSELTLSKYLKSEIITECNNRTLPVKSFWTVIFFMFF